MSDDDWNTKLEKLLKETEQLKARVEALEPKAKVEFKVEPQGPIDWTQGMSMDRATMAALAAAVPDNLVRDIVGDNLRAASVVKPAETKVIPSERGWRPETPLGPPEGQRWVDAQLDVAAALDKRELEKKLGHKPE
jgi:hypothetical protein